MAPISRAKAKEMGLLRYSTGKPCSHGHIAERLVGNWVCVQCNRDNVKKQAEANPDRVRANKRASDRRNSATKMVRREEATGHKWLSQKVRDAVENGKLLKTPCEVCGKQESEAHHPDYSKPLSVVWLCRQHHLEIHNGV